MALKVKTVEDSTSKWRENAARAAEACAREAEAAASEWQKNTEDAADTFYTAITAPGMKERFKRGVTRAGAAKFARKVALLIPTRFGPGITAGEPDYRSGIEPFLSTIAALTLSKRQPRGDPANIRRVEEVNKALHAKRLALLGVGAK